MRKHLIDELRETSIDSRFENRIGIEPGRGGCAVSFEPLQAQEGSVRQHFRQPLSEPRLAAAKRADDVVERPNIAQLETLAAPRPWKVKRNIEPSQRPQQLSQFNRMFMDSATAGATDTFAATCKPVWQDRRKPRCYCDKQVGCTGR